MNSIITIKDGKVIPNENVLGIPELKKVWDKFEEPDKSLIFQYLHHLYQDNSPYYNLAEDEREERVRKDFQGNYKPNFDKDIIKAKEKMSELTWSPIKDMLEGLKINLRNISTYLKTAEVDAGRDGNLSQLTSLHKSAKDLIKNYKATEQEFMLESAKNRGNTMKAIDEGDDY